MDSKMRYLCIQALIFCRILVIFEVSGVPHPLELMSDDRQTRSLKIDDNQNADPLNLLTQCQQAIKNPLAYVDPASSPDDLCSNLKCKFPDSKIETKTWTRSLNRKPTDGSYCGESGVCELGACKVQISMTNQCQLVLKTKDAYVDQTKSPDSLCKNLICRQTDKSNSDPILTSTTQKPALKNSPCGRGGRCMNGTCIQPPPPVIPENMTSQCQSATKEPLAEVNADKSADEVCGNLQCQFPDKNDPLEMHLVKLNRPAEEYTACGNSGTCRKGRCVDGPDMTTQCQKNLNNKEAVVDFRKSPDSLCANLVCRCPSATKKPEMNSVQTDIAATEFSACGRHGRCINGACCQPPPPVAPSDMSTQCVAAIQKQNAHLAPNTTPEELCKNLKCRYADVDDPEKYYLVDLKKPAAEFTECGISGSCIKGDCVVEQSMKKQCEKFMKSEDADVESSKTPNSLCSDLVCTYPDEGNPTKINIMETKTPPLDYTPCGRHGRCINGACSEPPRPKAESNMTEQCRSATKHLSAEVDPEKTPDELCDNLECRYPDESDPDQIHMIQLNRPPKDYTPCGENSHCVSGKCVKGALD